MKTNLIFLSLSLGLLLGCRSTEDTVEPVGNSSTTTGVITPISSSTTTAPGSTSSTTSGAFAGLTPSAQGTFVNNGHRVMGTVKVFEKDGKQTLVFTNFSSDTGPDLRIYVAENTGLRNFVELTRLGNSSGNFSVELPADVDPAKQRYVLIWCKAFSVLFGNAELK